MMMVNDQNGRHEGSKEPLSEPFPVGMRVLAVDDDRTCLRMLEQMLLKCRYNVTATTQSRKAIEMLRENKDKFDLVISDVHMPDIDGFKLLELVGLEMDLPVIMVTEHKEPNLVKKGVVHGACDYLLKPVRMEELQIIWRHVFRKKLDSKDHKAYNVTEQGIQGVASENCANHDKRLGKRRKEQSEEEEEDDDDNEHENENAATHKKPRLVWGKELRSKFEAAVNQLGHGHDKVVPKKILELMNVEGLTRENVASYLQKYRLNKKRAAQKGWRVAASSGCDTYLHRPLLDQYASDSRRLTTAGLPSYASGGIFPRQHSPCALNLRGMSSSSPLVRVGNSQNMTGSIRGLCNIQPTIFATNQSSNFVQGIPAPNELYQFRQNNYATGIRQLNPADIPSDNCLSGFTSNNPLLQGNYPATHNLNALRNHSPLGAAYVRAGSFDTSISGSSNLLEYNPCSEAMQMETKLTRVLANSLPSGQSFNNDQLPQSNLKFSSSTSHVGNIMVDPSSRSEGLIGNVIEASCSIPQQGLEQHKEDLDARLSSSVGDTSSLGHASNKNNNIGIKRVDASFSSQQNEATPSVNQNTELEDACVFQQSDFDSLDDILNDMDFDSLDDILIDMVTPAQNGYFS